MDLLVRGCVNRKIAAQLHLSQNTVKIHLHKITAKLGVSNKWAAAAVYHDRMRRLERGWKSTTSDCEV